MDTIVYHDTVNITIPKYRIVTDRIKSALFVLQMLFVGVDISFVPVLHIKKIIDDQSSMKHHRFPNNSCLQGFLLSRRTEFPDFYMTFPRLRLNATLSLRPFTGGGGQN